ncbi:MULTISPECIES: RNase E specificity factor CsrD [unclassified Aliivibrio]|uniref:RNase E specificity factor CsrD n=1 Tax=unclassified Aliivibrio TaxID=2645654 RepID=UPI00080EA54D|nr:MULTISPECIES: RNase E specificity factor CsrD [unclassified Aliivibrio]OCH13221.1 RNase E specificity factor CsrD [Aliivibrio sp. 1S165]OCH25222.1 RNase E specificity factor CsrD [Aliivibrio sp. 1S128]OCH28089.1 RNase E specificity factor CsrD [Aliivibrio sp. 1S175]
MRKTPSLRLSNRLISFVTLMVSAAIFVLLIGGAISFKQIGNEYLEHYLTGIVNVVDEDLLHPEEAESMGKWLPKLLKASSVVSMELSSPSGLVYSFQTSSIMPDDNLLYQKTLPLQINKGYSITFKSIPPYSAFTYSLGALFSITSAIAVIIVSLLWGVVWLRKQLYGSELLEERGRMLLAGRLDDYSVGSEEEWPATASLALDSIISELKDARKERSRFDTFIRTHTFLDKLTGSANRVLFDSKLESTLQESQSQGVLLLLRINGWEELVEAKGKAVSDELIVEIGKQLNNLIQRYSDSVLSRYYHSDFALLIPQQSLKEAKIIAAQCLKIIDKITPPKYLDNDNWCHIGVSMYVNGERRGRLMDELDMAHRSALLQNNNSWSLFKKQQQLTESLGSVRWRTLFDAIFEQEQLLLYKQPMFLFKGSELAPLHLEIFSRIRDENGVQIKASRFLPAIKQVGYQIKLDSAVLKQVFPLLSDPDFSEHMFSVHLQVKSLQNSGFIRQLKNRLLQTPRYQLKRLSFELVEGQVVTYLDAVRPIAKLLKSFGCQLVVEQAGRTIVSTHYIKDLNVDYIKLHRSLMKDIHQRYENQLFVRSLLGACENTGAEVLAVGVENKKELKLLKELGVGGVQGRMFEAETALFNRQEKISIPKRRNRWSK